MLLNNKFLGFSVYMYEVQPAWQRIGIVLCRCDNQMSGTVVYAVSAFTCITYRRHFFAHFNHRHDVRFRVRHGVRSTLLFDNNAFRRTLKDSLDSQVARESEGIRVLKDFDSFIRIPPTCEDILAACRNSLNGDRLTIIIDAGTNSRTICHLR